MMREIAYRYSRGNAATGEGLASLIWGQFDAVTLLRPVDIDNLVDAASTCGPLRLRCKQAIHALARERGWMHLNEMLDWGIPDGYVEGLTLFSDGVRRVEVVRRSEPVERDTWNDPHGEWSD